MAKTRAKKAEELAILEKELQGMKSVIFARQDGLKAKETSELRKTLRDQQVGYAVVKKTLLKKALVNAKLSVDGVAPLTGTVVVAFGREDEVTPAKALMQFGKTHEAVRLLGGVVGGAYMDETQVMAFAKLPGKTELISMMVSVVSSPLRGFVSVMQGNLRGLVYALKAVQEKKVNLVN